MVKEIIRDQFLLSQKATVVTKEDLPLVRDLIDTLIAHRSECVGMAMNMIGYNKAAIVLYDGDNLLVMLNPAIIAKKDPYQTKEGCLSLLGVRDTVRYHQIVVTYQDRMMKSHKASFREFTAQIIQHECDHLAGIII